MSEIENGVEVLVAGPVLKIRGVNFHLHHKGGGLVAEGAQIDFSATIGCRAIVHPGARVCAEAQVLGTSVIGKGAVIAPGVTIRSSVIGDGARIGVGVNIVEQTIPDHADISKRPATSGSR